MRGWLRAPTDATGQEKNSPLSNQALPGFSATLMLKILSVAETRRQYIFEFTDDEGAKVSLYLSPNDIFIFSVTDILKEQQIIELPMGSAGIPIDKLIFLTCEIGVSGNATYIRVLVDGAEIGHREFPYRANLGSREWKKGTLFADIEGKNNSAFEAKAAAMGHVSLTDKHINVFIKSIRQAIDDVAAIAK